MSTNNQHFINNNHLTKYLMDAGQRAVLYWDVMRQRGNQFLEHQSKLAPHVLEYDFELIIDGRTLSEPVNYGLVKIIPPPGLEIDPLNRPFIIIDPRAGHGPGIGGFKAESEIGVALRAGHPCYFVGFLPQPEPGQTIESIMRAEARFVERVVELHPDAEGKPVVIGNCQAGWAAMMMAATRPELCGPLIVAGSPLSYWTGVRGVNPMRYTGGLLGGSWLTALTSDLGNGRFDGAWLVQNMEGLNPANTLWTKQYNLYNKIDTESPRYLGFERWWGGHVVLNGEEMQYIVDNLFVGNKLPSAQVVTSEGMTIDFRKIRSPIVCFCSKGDNITPPQQALGWILDLYEDVDDIRTAGQTIVYAVHESIGHLGIFVSGKVAKKEHQEFTENIDLIDCLPPGLYEAVLRKKDETTINEELVSADYISRFEARTLDDIRALGGNSPEDERCFATVARVSEMNLDLYRRTLQPLFQMTSNEYSAEWLRWAHPLRLSYELFSDRNPFMRPLASAAQWVSENRQQADPDNFFTLWQNYYSNCAVASLNLFRDCRDSLMEQLFFGIYSQPWLQKMMGLPAEDDQIRPRPGKDSERQAYVKQRIAELRENLEKGGPREAAVRAMLYIRIPESAADERGFEMLRRVRKERAEDISLDEFKQIVREQYFMLVLEEDAAVNAIPKLLKGHENITSELFEDIRKIVTAGGELGEIAQARLLKMKEIFQAPKPKTTKPRTRKASTRKTAAKK